MRSWDFDIEEKRHPQDLEVPPFYHFWGMFGRLFYTLIILSLFAIAASFVV